MAQLPQKHDWQIALRNWLSGRGASDYECGLPGLSFDASYFASDDDTYRAWVTFENNGRDITRISGVRIAPEHFLLESIESPEGVRMKLYYKVEPACLAWLYSWDYPGNPYYQNEQVRWHRADQRSPRDTGPDVSWRWTGWYLTLAIIIRRPCQGAASKRCSRARASAERSRLKRSVGTLI